MYTDTSVPLISYWAPEQKSAVETLLTPQHMVVR